MTSNDTTVAALLEQLIADGPQAMAQVMTALMNVAMKLEREQFLGAAHYERDPGRCGYANGLMAYGREVAARTEQFFCPIKHARRVVAAHAHYPSFFEYGDADSYRLGLERLRLTLSEVEPEA